MVESKFSLGSRRDCTKCGHVYHPANAFQELCWGCTYFAVKDKPELVNPVDLDPAIKVSFSKKTSSKEKDSGLPDDNTE